MQSRLAHAAEIGRRVGENAAVGKMIAHYLIVHGHELREVKPESAKWNHEMFCRQTGWNPKVLTNPEKRDAGRLAWLYQ